MKLGGSRPPPGQAQLPNPGQQPLGMTPNPATGNPGMVSVKQEGSAGNDLMVPGQTHLGSPDNSVPPYVDSTTFPSGPGPQPKSNNIDFFAQELVNGTLLTQC